MKWLLARSGVVGAFILFVAMATSSSMEPASAQTPTPVPTPVPGAPSVIVQIEDAKIVVGDPLRITLIAFDNQAVDWIRWDARLVGADNDNDDDDEDNDDEDNDEADNGDPLVVTVADPDNDNSLDDDEDTAGDNDNGSDNNNDNVDPNADPALAVMHEFECDEQTACANVWTIPTSKPGRYEITAEVRDTTGLRGRSRAEIEVRQTR
jgi:hypothetical protein